MARTRRPGQNGGFLGAGAAPFRVLGDPNDDDFRVDGLADEPERLARAARPCCKADCDRPAGVGARHASGSSSTSSGPWSCWPRTRRGGRSTSAASRSGCASATAGTSTGKALLLARRLVEAGVRLVTVYWGGKVNNPDPHWDTHFNNNRRLKEELLPPFDQCFTAFLEDLQARGLLESTLVIATGEFGRTPRFGQFTGNGVNETGRDHWAQCYSLLLAGGPAGGGRILGKSDRFAAYPADDPYTPQDLCADGAARPGHRPGRRRCATPSAARCRSARDGCRAALFGT